MSAQPARNQANNRLSDYLPVEDQIAKFREMYPTARLVTQRLDVEPLSFRAEVYLDGNDSAIPNATGHADVNGGMGNRSKSPTEATETAAIGRALAHLGVGRTVEQDDKRPSPQQMVNQVAQPMPDDDLPAGVTRGTGTLPRVLNISEVENPTFMETARDGMTGEQEKFIEKMAAAAQVDANQECERVFHVPLARLNRTAAAAFGKHLRDGAPDKPA